MNLLVDTHIAVWMVDTPQRLSPAAVELLVDGDNEVFFSVLALLEVAVKNGTGKSFNVDVARLRKALLVSGFKELTVTAEHAMQVGLLPPIHKDPFDRLLLAQAQIEFMTLMTVDKDMRRYPDIRIADI